MFFPPNTFSDVDETHAFVVRWYSKHLTAMEEPSLWAMAQQSKAHAYRFLWLRTFHQPIAVRMNIEQDGAGVLTAKRLDGMGGYEPGHLIQNESHIFAANHLTEFLLKLARMDFWAMSSTGVGCDGAQWILEGVHNGSYHLVDKHCPDAGAFRETMLRLIQWGGVPIDEVY